MQATTAAPTAGERSAAPARVGPVFIAGRQHSGNTVLAVMLGRSPACYAQIDENAFFEHRGLIDRAPTAAARAERVFEALKLEAAELKEEVHEHLARRAAAEPGADALSLYRGAMDLVAARLGRSFWAQKATSYIFYGREILSAMPEARLIYMLRSPYDIAASKKRRAKGREYIFATMISWNKGMRLARALLAEFPGRFRVVRYEDLTGRPRPTAEEVFAFLGVPFDESCLDVPHVNKSETGYSLTGDGKGLNRSRVNYYTATLTPAEIAALDMLADAPALRQWYPDLPHRGRPAGAATRARALLRLGVSPFHFAWDYATRLPRSPAHLVARSLHRLRA